MTARVLPPEEWHRLVPEAIDPAGQVLVVEDGGQIVGCVGLAWCLHAEDLWVAPAHRGKVGVVRALLREVAAIGARAGIRATCVAVPDPAVGAFVTRLGGASIGPHAVLPLERFS